MDKLNRPDIFLLIIASVLLLFQSLIMSNKLPTLTILGGEEEEEFPSFNKSTAMLECDQVIHRDITKGGSYYWNESVVYIGMGHGLASSITACKHEAKLRQ